MVIMKQVVVSKSQFKPQALHYLRLVQRSKKPVVITHKKKPVVKVVPYDEDVQKKLDWFKGTVEKYEDPLEPVAVDDWEALK